MALDEAEEEFVAELRELLEEEIRRNAPELAIVLELWCPVCGLDTIPKQEHDCITSLPNLKGLVGD